MSQEDSMAGDGSSKEEYESTLMLDELESLLEDFEEHEGTGPLPADLQSQLDALGLRDANELRRRIADIHAQLDAKWQG